MPPAPPRLSRPAIPAPDPALEAALRARLAGLAKPPGSLGRLEDLALQLGLISGGLAPRVERAELLIFAGDHGLTAEGVSAYPAAVTAAMVRTMAAGRASANALAAAVGASVTVIDVGVGGDLASVTRVVDAKVRPGTRNAAREPALTAYEVEAALAAGRTAAGRAIDAGADAILLGEMGIGNTSAAALIIHRLLPAPLPDCIGAGAGQDEDGLARKRAALERTASRTAATEPRAVLTEFGGLEIIAMAGAALEGAGRRCPVVIDGFIASAAALAAIRLDPECRPALVFAHRSAEAGHARLLAGLGAEPLLDLGLRLGEGTGALLALPMLRAAARLLTDVSSLDEVLAASS